MINTTKNKWIKGLKKMKYSEKHQVEFYECDENEHLKLPSLVD